MPNKTIEYISLHLACMDSRPNQQNTQIDAELAKIMATVWTMAEKNRDDTIALLSVLRALEDLHRQIRSELFESCLPHTRQHLYQLVREIEEQGGWPYIERMRLQQLLGKLEMLDTETSQSKE